MAADPDLETISLENLDRLSIHRRTQRLYWDGLEIVTRSSVRLGSFERWMVGLTGIGTFGVFVLELGKLLFGRAG
jgi:hypothetical protein